MTWLFSLRAIYTCRAADTSLAVEQSSCHSPYRRNNHRVGVTDPAKSGPPSFGNYRRTVSRQRLSTDQQLMTSHRKYFTSDLLGPWHVISGTRALTTVVPKVYGLIYWQTNELYCIYFIISAACVFQSDRETHLLNVDSPFGLVTERCHYNARHIFIIQCGIARFLCAMRVFEVRASSSSPRLPLGQILFLSRPPLLS